MSFSNDLENSFEKKTIIENNSVEDYDVDNWFSRYEDIQKICL